MLALVVVGLPIILLLNANPLSIVYRLVKLKIIFLGGDG
jgi:hypothetical protein